MTSISYYLMMIGLTPKIINIDDQSIIETMRYIIWLTNVPILMQFISDINNNSENMSM